MKRERETTIYALGLSASLYRDIYFQFNVANLSFVQCSAVLGHSYAQMINNALGQRCSGQTVPSLAVSQWHFPAAQQLQLTQKWKLCVIWDWAMPTSSSLPTLQFPEELHLGSDGWASWQSSVWTPPSALSWSGQHLNKPSAAKSCCHSYSDKSANYSTK